MKKSVLKNAKILLGLTVCLLLVFISSCKNDGAEYPENNSAAQSSENKIIEFGFKHADNTVLSEDVSAVIDSVDKIGNLIAVKFPAGTSLASLKKLKPYFSVSSGTKLYARNTMIVSGTTELDFSDMMNGVPIKALSEDGGSIIFKCFAEIAFPVPSTAEIEKCLGSYYGKLPAHGDIIIVIEKTKVTVYSKAMSVDYENTEWIKNPDNSLACRTYNKGKAKVAAFMLNKHDFTDSYESFGKTYPQQSVHSLWEHPFLPIKVRILRGLKAAVLKLLVCICKLNQNVRNRKSCFQLFLP